MPAVRLPVALFDTGTAADGALLGDSATDPHYRLIDADGAGLMPGAARTVVADGFPIGPWVGNDASSRWVVPAATDGDGNAAAGVFVYRTTFDLSQIDPASATVSGRWAADDYAEIYLNGVATGVTVTAGTFGSLTAFTLTSGFRPGRNDLDFVVQNAGGPTGLRVDGLTGSGLPAVRVAVPRVAFNTGVDALGQPLPDSSVPKVTGLNSSGAGLSDLAGDGNFAVTSAPSGYTGGTKVRKAVGGFPIPPWAGDTSGSSWLIPAAADSQGNAPPGVYSFTTTVTVTDPTNLVLSGLWAADNSARIYVNGNDTGVTFAGPEAFGSLVPFTLSGSYLAVGTNTIEFRVTNAGTSDNPVGLRVEWDAVATRIDPHYTVVASTVPGMVGPTKVVPGNAYPLPPWVANDSNSRWIAPLAADADGSAAPGTYTFQTTIDLTGYVASTAVLSGRWSADNEGVNVYLNGTALNLHRPGPNPGSGVEGFRAYSDFTIAGGWQAGVNTLTFVIRNDPLASGSTTPNPVGLRVDDTQLYAVKNPPVKKSVLDIQTDFSTCPPLLKVSRGTPTNPDADSLAPVRYADGVATVVSNDLSSPSFPALGASRTWTNRPEYALGGSTFGNNWVVAQAPRLTVATDGSRVWAVFDGTTALGFDRRPDGSYSAVAGRTETLTADPYAGTFTLIDSTGQVFTFHDFSTALASGLRGRVTAVDHPGGGTTTYAYDSAGVLLSLTRTGVVNGLPTADRITYAYLSGGVNAGKASSATLQESVNGGSWVTVGSVAYTYYDGVEANGNLGDLKRAVVTDSVGAEVTTDYYRYYVASEANGYEGGLKYLIEGSLYDQFVAAVGDPDAATDAQLAQYAGMYFEFDSSQRVTREIVSAAGCSVCSSGQGEFAFAYATNPSAGSSPGYNVWVQKTTETLPDGNENIVYTNILGQVLVSVRVETGSGLEWVTGYRYDSAGRVLAMYAPSAVSGYSESLPDLLDYHAANSPYIRDAAGLVTLYDYAGLTTATPTQDGSAAGYQNGWSIQRGEFGTPIPQESMTYVSRTANGLTTYHVATDTVFANDDRTGARTTSYAYDWYADSQQAYSVTTTMPTVSTAQNGSGVAATSTVAFDTDGRVVWSKDAGGFLTYNQYDQATGSLLKTIADVDTTQTSTFANLPSGWVTPVGGGLHLTRTYEYDTEGRTTKSVDAKGNVTYTVYLDAGREVRTYAGWDAATNKPTGPTQVSKRDVDGRFVDSLTMSAAPTIDGSGRPTGAEAIANIESWTRTQLNSAGQAVATDTYFDLTSITYSVATPTVGVANTNFYRTTQDYDKQGRPNKSVSAAGTIYRTEYDGQGRVVSEWVGTDDTPTAGFWSVTNLAGTDMVKVREYQYDGGGVGDSNLTKVTEFPGGGAADRVTQSFFDWRNRTVATKSGVEATESASVNRPISYSEYNNLGELLSSETYDGDGVNIVDANNDGVPDRPSSSLLRSKSTAEYDPWGRAFRSTVWSVDPSTGAVSSTGLVSQSWFDSRGNTVKSSSPGGLVSKAQFDGVGRTTVSFVTDGGGDTAYADAFTVTGDIVLSQGEYTYDANSNGILTTSRERFHTATGTGALGTPTTGVNARVSYSTAYYDKADRTTDVVNVGTNGGTAYTRPGTVPARSDTVLVTSYLYDTAGRLKDVTDPRGLTSRTEYDLMGRTAKSIQNYVDGVVSDADDKTTVYGYGPAGMNSLTSLVTGGGGQTTESVYGVSPATGSTITSNDIVGATRWPDPTTGAASSSEQETTAVNALGQTLTATDRNGNVHTLTYDVLGRVVSDAVTTLGTGVDGAVRRVDYAYDSQGNQFLVTSYDAASGGTIVNQVKREFNGLGQLTAVWQSHAGAVTGSSPKVGYTYTEMAGGANHSRLTGMTYPSGYSVGVNYASGLDSTISRMTSFTDASGTLVAYSYLGLGTVVVEDRPQPDFALSHVLRVPEALGDAGDVYTGLDRFGRVVRMRWLTGSGAVADGEAYTHDRDGNRLTAANLVNAAFDETYTYDALNQLLSFARGSRSQVWDYDAQGNFESITTNGVTETRTHNRQNEVTGVGASSLTFDANGNMTTDETGRQFVYDAWNRLVVVKDSGGATLKTFGYDGQGWRVTETVGTTTRDLYYSAGWQVAEETVTTGSTTKLNARYVWGGGYVDDLVYRQRDTDNDGVLDERLWATHDANFNITALVNDLGTVVERYAYDAYGVRTVLDASWNVLSGSAFGFVHGFQGLRFDEVAGLSDSRNRWYSPTLGRFVTNDPIRYEAGDVNLYRFVGNSPGMGVDPFGLAGPLLPILGLIAVGGALGGMSGHDVPPPPAPEKWEQRVLGNSNFAKLILHDEDNRVSKHKLSDSLLKDANEAAHMITTVNHLLANHLDCVLSALNSLQAQLGVFFKNTDYYKKQFQQAANHLLTAGNEVNIRLDYNEKGLDSSMKGDTPAYMTTDLLGYNYDNSLYLTKTYFKQKDPLEPFYHEMGRLYGNQRATDNSNKPGDVYVWDRIVRIVYGRRDEILECGKSSNTCPPKS